MVYNLKSQNWKRYFAFCRFVKKVNNTGLFFIVMRSLVDSIRYNISPMEYFQFRFFEKDHTEKLKWAGTGTMYEFQLVMNPKSKRSILDDKREFYKSYNQYVIHKTASLEELKANHELRNYFLSGANGKLVFKVSDGKCGFQVEMRSIKEFNSDNLISFMEKNGYDLLEEFIRQHEEMNRLSPSTVNTVRVITQLDKNNQVVILGCRQRISVDSHVDNLASGNIVASIDEQTGIINSSAVYSDITKEDVTVHPSTGTEIIGFQVPFWSEIIDMVKNAALLHPQNRSIGWDVVVTDKGPGLIEGNHDWCKLVWQLPVKQGLKSILDKHLKEYLDVRQTN